MLIPLNNKIFVEKVDKLKERSGSGFSSYLESNNNLGIVSYIDKGLTMATGLQKGSMVYFGPKLDRIFVEGKEVMVMDYSNIFGFIKSEISE